VTAIPRPFLIVLGGPTASGKTALGLEVAERCGGEIVNADSQQVYRHFDIGTAKASPAEQARCPHHLLSVAEPHEQFSAAQFQAQADAAISQIAARGRTPVVLGGTGLYLRVLLHGVMPAPPASPQLRRGLEEEAARLGRPALHQRLREVDPRTAEVVKPTDLVRIIRALEVHALTGRPVSELRGAHRFGDARYPHALFVLAPERGALYRAIDARTRALFEGGLPDEVRRLVARGYRDTPPMRSVGYVQALALVEGRLSLDEAVAQAAQQTRRYAKRQLTWFRKEPLARFLAPPYDAQAVIAQARAARDSASE
jgi:tRNA dimethylallyltransferase